MNKQQVKGATNQATGAVKKEVGKMTGDRSTQARGTAQEIKGKVQQGVGNAKEDVRSNSDIDRSSRTRRSSDR
ncbi:CsbD family protein [Ramlibacter ginsenosidimutans]|uniref:CsbD family protein n=1 Tax=Ramlibacter ginsenosidimutans TaxID=502333 RepID=A0A934TYG3_9BURK|nr:CsbD family protein [Ramlibacter ginsenosidimutans]MBK6009506.1 CsbD family protein [Ramlibacter ginsenosidimutans]